MMIKFNIVRYTNNIDVKKLPVSRMFRSEVHLLNFTESLGGVTFFILALHKYNFFKYVTFCEFFFP